MLHYGYMIDAHCTCVQAAAAAVGHSEQKKSPPAASKRLTEAARSSEVQQRERSAQRQMAEDLAALEDATVGEAMERCLRGAAQSYPSIYESAEMSLRLDEGWNSMHDSIENAWFEQYSTIKRLLEGLQHATVKKRARVHPSAPRRVGKAYARREGY
jgi:hypothetical protein